LQLLSDPLGVDFRPYLIRVLASVKQNWLAVIPRVSDWDGAGRWRFSFRLHATAAFQAGDRLAFGR